MPWIKVSDNEAWGGGACSKLGSPKWNDIITLPSGCRTHRRQIETIPKRMDKSDVTTNKTLIFIAVLLTMALITCLFAVLLAPWYYSINTQVRLHLEAPAETKIKICWDESQTECLPLVPYSTIKKQIPQPGEVANLWLGELPPRPKYMIGIKFSSRTKEAIFSKLELDSTTVLLYGDRRGTGIGKVESTLDHFSLHRISHRSTNAIHYIDVRNGGRLTLKNDIYQGTHAESIPWPSIIVVWGLLLSLVLFVAIPVYLFPHIVNNAGSALAIVNKERLPWWIFVIFICLVFLMVTLVGNSGILLHSYDPLGYLFLALSGEFFDDVRLPGYPLFLNFALMFSDHSLNGVILIQAISLSACVMACVYALQRWISPLMSVVFVLLCLFSPAQVYWARWILRESIFTGLVLLGVAVAICHFASQKRASNTWLFVFSIICGIAFLVRENGFFLPVVLLPGLVPKLIKAMKEEENFRTRLRSILLLSARYASPLVVLAILFITFSAINYVKFGYFQVGRHQTSHDHLVRAIYPSTSDARALLNPGSAVLAQVNDYNRRQIYGSYIVARDQAPNLDPIYLSIFPSVEAMADDNSPRNRLRVAEILNKIGREMENMVPWQAAVGGRLRQYRQILSMEREQALYPSHRELQPSLTPVLKQFLAMPGLSATLKFLEKNTPPGGTIERYYEATQYYSWYPLLLILALLSSIYVLRWEDPVFLAPIAYFLVNALFLIVVCLTNHRYIENFDVLLILQAALGMSLLLRRIKSQRSLL